MSDIFGKTIKRIEFKILKSENEIFKKKLIVVVQYYSEKRTEQKAQHLFQPHRGYPVHHATKLQVAGWNQVIFAKIAKSYGTA